MARKSSKGRTWSIELTVVGLNYRWKKEGREMLARNVPVPIALEREPDNKVHENAIKVVIAGDYKLTKLRGVHLGYLRANIADKLAPKMDAGTLELVKAWATKVKPEDGTADAEFRFRDKSGSTKRKKTKA